jgi:hypothetical protein
MTEEREQVAKLLKSFGVASVYADYDGSGDQGQIDTPDFLGDLIPGTEQVVVIKVEDNMAQRTLDLFYALLEDIHGGWEIDEGSFGQIEWNLKTDKIHLTHNNRFMQVDTSEDEL